MKTGDKAVANDRYFPLMLRTTHQFSENFDLTSGVGVDLGRMITIDYGDRDGKDRVDPQVYFQLSAILYF